MKSIKSLILASSLMVAGAAQAVPAYPGLIPMTQPDGSVVNVQLHGDEHSSYMLTEDGYLLKELNRTLHYADVDAQGRVVASPFVATAPDARSAEAQKFLKQIDMKGTVMPAVMANIQAEQIRREHEMQRVGALGLFPKRNFPAFGDQKAIVILVEFDEVEFRVDNPHDYFTRMLNEDGFSDYGGEGSAAQWYREQSSGQFRPVFDVYGPVKMPKPMKFYGENNGTRNDLRPYMLPIHACQALDDEVDFSEYDRDGDGYIDNVFMFYAGGGENAGASGDTLWPHSWDLSYAAGLALQNGDGDITNYMFDGKKLEHYGLTNEWFTATNRPDGIGTFCHEFGHILGLPDLYNTANQRASFTPDAYDTMDRGSYNNNSCTPPNFSVFERHALGWLEPLTLTGEKTIRLQPITTNTGIYLPTPNKTEYYLLENRQKTGWDAYIPGEGMLIWHIDYDSQKWYSNTVNNVNAHQCIDLVEADGRTSASTRYDTPFPGTKNDITDFTNFTVPSMRTWDGKNVDFPLTEITRTAEGNIVFNVAGGKKFMEPLAVEADDIHHQGFTLNWAPNNRATNYLVTITDENGDVLDGLSRVPAGLTTSFAITGLEPLTIYKAHVLASADYEESDPLEITVTTGEDTFRNYATIVSAPQNVTDNQFSVSWEPVEGAVDYQLNLYTKTRGEALTEELGFDNGIANLPDGWITTSTADYTSKSNSGKNPGSLRCSDSGTHITSPWFTDDIHSVSFWARLTLADGSTVYVYALVDGEWKMLEEVAPTNKGANYLVENLPAGTRSVKLVFNRVDAASLALDDIELKWGGEFSVVPVTEYVDRSTGNVTSYTIKFGGEAKAPLFVTEEDTDVTTAYNTYYYNVKAVNAAGEVSRPSNEQLIMTASTVGIADVNFDSNFTVAVVGRTLIINGASAGVTIATPSGASTFTTAGSVTVPAGIYIVSNGVKARKVVVK